MTDAEIAKGIASKIKDYQEEMWFLGTDILFERDLDLMNEGKGTAFNREEGAIYLAQNESLFEEEGYSYFFIEIIKEARERGYVWIFFDRDIQTNYIKTGVSNA